MMNEQEINELGTRLHSAIQDAVSPDQAQMVSRWVLVMETVHDGGRTTSYTASESMALWEILGMLETAREYTKSELTLQLFSSEVEDDEDEGDDTVS